MRSKLSSLCAASSVLAMVALVAAMPGGSPSRAIIALERERSLGNGTLADDLASADTTLAARAALALGRTKKPEAAPLLVAHLSDPRTSVRALSVYGLGLIANGTAVDRLVAALNDPSGAVRIAALDAIGRNESAAKIGHDGTAGRPGAEEGVESAVAATLANDADPVVRGRAAITLGAFTSTAVRGPAVMALSAVMANEHNPLVRERAMWAIFRSFATIAPSQVVESGLGDPDEVVRIEALRALGRIGGDHHVWPTNTEIAWLDHLAGDASWRVQEQANETLHAVRQEPPTEHQKRLLRGLHLPQIAPDPFAALPALPRTPVTGNPVAPTADDAIIEPAINPENAIDMVSPAAGPHPRVRITTTQGNVYVTLYPEWAPLTVANFLALVNSGYYDDNQWFRIVPDFVVQTGDKTNTGDGDAGYMIPAEENPLEQNSYVISMGLNYTPQQKPERDSAGTQYYITLSPQYHLDNDFTVFGSVTSGADVLAHLAESDKVTSIERIGDEVVKR